MRAGTKMGTYSFRFDVTEHHRLKAHLPSRKGDVGVADGVTGVARVQSKYGHHLQVGLRIEKSS
jgi:hypothetical protein